jgi:ABC-2 type transport system ATP-binding protein
VRRSTVREHVLDCLRPRPVERLVVLDSLSFAVEPGEAVGIMGRNGSGKSTLLKVIAGIYQADGGSVAVRAPMTPVLELGLGWNRELDAIDNILLVGSLMGMSVRAAKAATDEILAFAELERFANLKVQHYSSGMAARLAYAVAFHAVRDILILDEIFAVGDAGFQARCEARYRELHASGRTILLVSHNPAIIGGFCRRALLLEDGRIRMDADAPAVAAEYTRRLREPVADGAARAPEGVRG